ESLWWSLALGACLGGNGTLIGASANVIVAGLAAQEGYSISFKKYFKVAFPLMLLSIVIASVYIYVRYLI
ncbi:MAG: anion permease, partial [Sporomusaceae bacterium]|nr:anion permease [Sporomusaceae bacterium]